MINGSEPARSTHQKFCTCNQRNQSTDHQQEDKRHVLIPFVFNSMQLIIHWITLF
jgi:hypothetical protein